MSGIGPEESSSTLGEMRAGGVITVPWVAGMRAGVGYDSAARVSKGVSPAKTSSKFEGDELGIASFDFSIRRVENVDELQDYLQIEGGISGAYKLFSGSVSSDFVRNVRINTYSIYFLIKAVAICDTESATPIEISKKTAKLTADKFRKMYGDYYVSARKKASAFFGLLEVKAESNEARTAVVSTLKASFGDKVLKTGNLIEASFSNAVLKASAHEGVSLSLQVIAQGVGPDILQLTNGFTSQQGSSAE
jgi:hypothetical protein